MEKIRTLHIAIESFLKEQEHAKKLWKRLPWYERLKLVLTFRKDEKIRDIQFLEALKRHRRSL